MHSLRVWSSLFVRKLSQKSNKFVCLGVETSCDDTGIAVVDSNGEIFGESVHSQLQNTIRFGGVIPPIAAEFHRQSLKPALADVLSQMMQRSKCGLDDVDFISVTYAPGIPITLRTGIEFAKELAIKHKKPLIPIHHMQAHALTPRLLDSGGIKFPFLVLLISGGHSLLVFIKSPLEFSLLGSSLDDAPGEIMDKTARLLKLQHIPEFQKVAGGRAVEILASRSQKGPTSFEFPHVMTGDRNCDFSFAGLKYHARKVILRQERDLGILGGTVVHSAADICSSLQLAILRHLSTRLARAIAYCDMNEMWKDSEKTVVVSGGVASNQFFRSGLSVVCSTLGCQPVFPPVKYCTDNGVMIAWNAIEKLNWRRHVLNENIFDAPEILKTEEQISQLEPVGRLRIGEDLRQAVAKCHLRAPRVKLVI